MQQHNVTQGSAEWLALRAQHFSASDAPAMMGVSKYQTYKDLLREKATGLTPDIDPQTQARFDRGHAAEESFRPIAERLIGEPLYPVVGSIEIDGLKLLASFDGLTMDGEYGFEHKLWNESIADYMKATEEPPEQYVWQLEQQLLVSGAKLIHFITSDGTGGKFVGCEYVSKPERRAALIAGWKQFAADLANYTPEEYIPKPVAQAVTALPAVAVQVSGAIAIRENFDTFKNALTEFVTTKLIREPKTDQDFVDLDLQIKALVDAEKAIKGAEANMLSQVETVDAAKRMLDTLHKLARDNRLAAEKLLEEKKVSVRAEIIKEGRDAYDAHIRALNERIGKPYLSTSTKSVPDADFAGAAKGKRTLETLRAAVQTELNRAKIEASAIADRIDANMKTLRESAKDHAFLFADTAQIVLKDPADFVLLVNARIADHKAKEEKRLEDERARIRAEEAAKLKAAQEAEAAAKLKAEQDAEAKRIADANATEQATKAAAEATAKAAALAPAPIPIPPTLTPLFAAPEPKVDPVDTTRIDAFLQSREWSSPGQRNTARAVLVEFVKFEQLAAVAA